VEGWGRDPSLLPGNFERGEGKGVIVEGGARKKALDEGKRI